MALYWIQIDGENSTYIEVKVYHFYCDFTIFMSQPTDSSQGYIIYLLHTYCDLITDYQSGGHDWTEEECDIFEKLSHTGSWSVLMGQVVAWRPKPDGSSNVGANNMIDELPVLKFIDTNTEQVLYSNSVACAVNHNHKLFPGHCFTKLMRVSRCVIPTLFICLWC